MTLGTFYLVVAAALLFGACLVATRKIFPHLHGRIVAGMGVIAVLTVVLIWMLLATANRHGSNAAPPTTQPSPLLQPDRE